MISPALYRDHFPYQGIPAKCRNILIDGIKSFLSLSRWTSKLWIMGSEYHGA